MKQIVPTTPEHVAELARTMREADVEEVWAAAKLLPLEALQEGVQASDEPFTGLMDGKVVCIFGVAQATVLSEEGEPWLLASDLIDETAHTFLRVNRVYVREIKKRYSKLSNYVDERNTAAKRWLRWLGFELQPAEPYGAFGLPFHKFEYRRA